MNNLTINAIAITIGILMVMATYWGVNKVLSFIGKIINFLVMFLSGNKLEPIKLFGVSVKKLSNIALTWYLLSYQVSLYSKVLAAIV